MLRYFLIISIFCIVAVSKAQSNLNSFFKPSDSINKSRRNAVLISEAALATISIVGLNEIWYKDYPKSNFKTLNDSNEWLQMDKFGHTFSAYQLSRLTSESLRWSGEGQKEQLIFGAAASFTFLTAIEVLDGFSKEWGFSWSDMVANTTGVSLYIAQELLWQEQRILIKYSFQQTKYASIRPEKLGNSLLEQVFKDYNGQTYWLSFNLHSFFNKSRLPKWLNIAIGYGGDGMLTGKNETLNGLFTNQNRRRQYYLSFDVDFSKIKTDSNVLKTIFSLINVVKFPFPGVEFTDKNDIKFHAISF